MLSYGVGTGGVLLGAGLLSGGFLARRRLPDPGAGAVGKRILGCCVPLLGIAVLTGLDKRLEALAVSILPSWIYGMRGRGVDERVGNRLGEHAHLPDFTNTLRSNNRAARPLP